MPAGRQKEITQLTDSSGGTPSATDTVIDVPAAYTEADIANIVATLTAKLNEVISVVGRDS